MFCNADFCACWRDTSRRSRPAINPEIEPEFLDQELRELHLDPTARDNRVDLLVRVTMRDGQSEILYLHLEVQSFAEPDFAERIFNCFAALRRACGREVISLVILADLDPDWRPSQYTTDRLGCSLEFKFPCCKLLDRLPDWDDDISLPALTAKAQIAALRSSRDPRRRLDLRWQLTRALLTHGYSRAAITESLRMISWMMQLPSCETIPATFHLLPVGCHLPVATRHLFVWHARVHSPGNNPAAASFSSA